MRPFPRVYLKAWLIIMAILFRRHAMYHYEVNEPLSMMREPTVGNTVINYAGLGLPPSRIFGISTNGSVRP